MIFRERYPYIAHYSDKEFFFLNRHYKQLGNWNYGERVNYPEIGEMKTIIFYNDGFSGKKKDLGIYMEKLRNFKKLGLKERRDFVYPENGETDLKNLGSWC
jgi:hypothetical protein